MNEFEQRREKRINVTITLADNTGGLKKGIIKNLSQVGALITNSEPVPQSGSHILIRFCLPTSKEEIMTKAKVMWYNTNGHSIGVLFYDMEKKYLNLLKYFLEKEQGLH